ncbi:ATP-dependent helicase HrpB [Vibrio astriarenae]|uniref:ATP-dependent helicase HrpB n=1 Tax=Vibrio astriarenae TaxID=1481923 RepID=UPI0037370BFB
MSQLPINNVLPQLLSAVEQQSQVILKAAPGAGKSTHFPLKLLEQHQGAGKIIMLEPRRLAAKSIANYIAQQKGENVGESVGYRIKGETKSSSHTKLEIVTEGILTRMIQSDPELSDVDVLLFDEFHERSLHADTALALSLEIQAALRDDLTLVVMSATLDDEALLALLPEAIYIESRGRAYPVEHQYRALTPNERLPAVMSAQIEGLMANQSGSLLAFLPGVGAIKQVESLLNESARLGVDVDIYPLYGALDFKQQQLAIAPSAKGRRKIVLATNIAETSLTIEGIRMVVDSGLERVAKFDLTTGITRLEQQRIAQSSAEQRSGRAGRLEPGVCVRLYSESQLMQQPVVPNPDILHSDLAPLAMELLNWGAHDPSELQWLDLPPPAAMNQAFGLLCTLGLIDDARRLTSMGKQAYQLGLEPRLASMLLQAKSHGEKSLMSAIVAAALIEEVERNVVDLAHSLHRLQTGRHDRQALVKKRIDVLARKLSTNVNIPSMTDADIGLALALGYPDRVAQRRSAQTQDYRLANGHGAQFYDESLFIDQDYVVAVDVMRIAGRASVIQAACSVDIRALEQQSPSLFIWHERVDWSEAKGRLVAEKQQLLGKLLVAKESLPEPDSSQMSQALLSYVQRKGLEVLDWNAHTEQLYQRVLCAIDWLPEQNWPLMEKQSLIDDIESWLLPYLNGVNSVKQLSRVNVSEALLARLGWPLNQQLDEWVPQAIVLPTGRAQRLHYQQGKEPMLSVRMQEMYGEPQSPTVALGKVAVVIELLSPAHRPLQVTKDLAGFWSGSYREVQKEMKGRYPKHVWPDDPAQHQATTKTKRQLGH